MDAVDALTKVTLHRGETPAGGDALAEGSVEDLAPSEYDALADLFLSDLGGGERPAGGAMPVAARERVNIEAGIPHAFPIAATTTKAATAPPRAGDGPSDGRVARVEAGARRVEALVLGHLPVLAAAWVGQYARRLGETLGRPVVLLRLHAGQLTVELTGPIAPETQRDLERQGAIASLEAALAVAARHAGAWLIRADEPEEVVLAEGPGLTDVTLLTGADEAALVATYRTLKALTRSATAHATERGGDAVVPRFRVAILGATPERARDAEEKLSRTAGTFLDQPVTITNAGQRIGTAPCVLLHRGSVGVPAARVLHLIDRVMPAAEVARASSSRIGPTTFPGASAGSALESKMVVRTPHDLAALFDGIRGLPTRCPYAPGVQLGVDGRGRLHLLAMTEDDPRAGDVGPARSIAQLVAASGWVCDHLELLRLASPGYTIADDEPGATLHLLTSEPKSVRRLLDSGVLVHAVVPATIQGLTTWVVRDLN